MFVQPGVQVKPVIDAAPTETDFWHVQLSQERDPDTEVKRRLFLGQTTNRGQRQVDDFHVFVLCFFWETTYPLEARR